MTETAEHQRTMAPKETNFQLSPFHGEWHAKAEPKFEDI
jgi:hypothetical protein